MVRHPRETATCQTRMTVTAAVARENLGHRLPSTSRRMATIGSRHPTATLETAATGGNRSRPTTRAATTATVHFPVARVSMVRSRGLERATVATVRPRRMAMVATVRLPAGVPAVSPLETWLSAAVVCAATGMGRVVVVVVASRRHPPQKGAATTSRLRGRLPTTVVAAMEDDLVHGRRMAGAMVATVARRAAPLLVVIALAGMVSVPTTVMLATARFPKMMVWTDLSLTRAAAAFRACVPSPMAVGDVAHRRRLPTRTARTAWIRLRLPTTLVMALGEDLVL